MGGVGSGGARATSGPPPDPQALRRDRKDDGAWVTLPSTGIPVAPEWPLVDPGTRELGIWKALWTERPQAHEWLRLRLADEVALYVRQFVKAEDPESSAATLTTLKQFAESLGISIPGMQRNRWKIMGDGSSEQARSRPPVAQKATSSRSRLKVVRAATGD